MRRKIAAGLAALCFTVIIPTIYSMIAGPFDPATGYQIIAVSAVVGIAALVGVFWPEDSVLAQLSPDWPIHDLFMYIDPDQLEDDNPPVGSVWREIGDDIKDHFSTGSLAAWGRRAEGGTQPLTEIPKTYWPGASFTYWFFDCNDNSQSAHVIKKNDDDYRDLRVSKSQATRIFKPRKPLDADDNLIWWAFAFPSLVLLPLVGMNATSDLMVLLKTQDTWRDVSIEMTPMLSFIDSEDAVLTGPWTFTNTSPSTPHLLDIKIEFVERETGRTVVFDTVRQRKTVWRDKLKKAGSDAMRGKGFLEFPLRIEPADMAEGYIDFAVKFSPDQFAESSTSVIVLDRQSNNSIKLEFGVNYDATRQKRLDPRHPEKYK